MYPKSKIDFSLIE
jgi:hypothetical protein